MSTIAIQVLGLYGEIDQIPGTKSDLFRYCVRTEARGEQLVEGYAGDVDEAFDSIRAHARYILDAAAEAEYRFEGQLAAA